MLWEALSGRHPFWQTSMLETARAIAEGAPKLETLRPDLPKPLLALVDRALSPSPARRPRAAELAAALRGAAAPRRKPAARGVSRAAVPFPLERVAASALAAVFAGWSAAALPFYPAGWAAGLAVAAAAVTALRPRLGVAAALAVPVLPLGNVSTGLAVAYAALAALWVVLSWREPHDALLFAVGPLLAPLAALGLVPLAAWRVRSAPRRALQAAAAVVAAAVVAGVRGVPLPLTGASPPLGLGVAGAGDPLDVAGTLARAAAAHPALLVEAVVLAAIAVVLPFARLRGRWGAAGVGAAMLVLAVLAVPSAAAAPLVAAAWATAAAVALAADRVR